MSEQKVAFQSDGLKLDGLLTRPAGAGPFAAFVLLHGFGGHKDGPGNLESVQLLSSFGYAVLRFDFRGCGASEGPPGRTICLEQVEDVKNAVTWLSTQPGIDPKRIGVIGHSFGAAVAVYSAGVDERIAACVSAGGWGDGAKKFRRQHASPEAWRRFVDMMEEGRRRKARGEQLMVNRFDIVPIPEALRKTIAANHVMEFPYDVVESMYTFRANDVVDRIAPRPLLLLHSAKDSVTPTEQSVDLFAHARQPADLFLVSGMDHFGFQASNVQLVSLLRHWLDRHFPA